MLLLGEYEPNDEECEWPSDSEDEDDEDGENGKEEKEKKKKEQEARHAREIPSELNNTSFSSFLQEKDKKEVSEEDMKGVPEFWLTIFKNVELLQEMVQEHDEAVLKSLYDITVTFNKDPMVSNY